MIFGGKLVILGRVRWLHNVGNVDTRASLAAANTDCSGKSGRQWLTPCPLSRLRSSVPDVWCRLFRRFELSSN